MTATTPVLPDPGGHFIAAECTETLCDRGGGPVHVIQQLRILMVVLAPNGDFVFQHAAMELITGMKRQTSHQKSIRILGG